MIHPINITEPSKYQAPSGTINLPAKAIYCYSHTSGIGINYANLMCGISAIVDRNNRAVPETLLHAVNDKARHRGPDGGSVFLTRNLGLGHRRLSIIDLRECGRQPMEKYNCVISYNGEIYNFLSLKKELQRKGYTFQTRTDTEVILAAYDCWKDQCDQHFEGMWGFVLYDRQKNILFCSRDRFGQKPLHYTLAGNYFAITSEIKQMTMLPSFRATCNEQAAFHFLNHGALNYSSDTMFEHVFALPAGHNLEYNLTSHTYIIKQWYAFRNQPVNNIPLDEAAYEFRRLFEQSVRTRLQSDVPVGASLSGGLDSSSVCCTMRNLEERKPQKNISVCWDDPHIDERSYMEAVISATGNTSIQVFPDMNELQLQRTLNKVIYHQDQPILSASHFSEYKLYETAAHEGLTVMIDGQGADEYLGGYNDFNFYYLHGLLNQGGIKDFVQQWKKLSAVCSMPFTLFLRNCIELRYRHYFPGIHPFLNQKWAKKHLEKDPGLLPGREMFDMRSYTRHQLFVSSLPYQMHSADRNSMCHSIEARLPFLDHRLVEFTYSLPDTQKIKDGLSKVVMREALHDILPEKIRNRKTKLGFPAPEKSWMAVNADWVNQEIAENLAALPGIFNEKYIKSLLTSFTKGLLHDYSVFFRLISFGRWASIFNVTTSRV